MHRRWIPALWPICAVLLLSCFGCVQEQHDGFTGTITKGQTTILPKGTVSLDGDFGAIPSDKPRAYWGFSLSGDKGSIILVYDQAAAGEEQKVSNKSLVDVYYLSNGDGYAHHAELDHVLCSNHLSPSQIQGLHHLSGKCNVTHWEDNIDFRVEMAMHSDDDQPIKVDGVLSCVGKAEFNPGKWMVYTLAELRLISDSEEAPQAQAKNDP